MKEIIRIIRPKNVETNIINTGLTFEWLNLIISMNANATKKRNGSVTSLSLSMDGRLNITSTPTNNVDTNKKHPINNLMALCIILFL
jgi:hypothetical protein